jgi:hypothetical protein
LLQDTVTSGMWDSVISGASIVTVDITPLDGTSATQSFTTGGGAAWSGSSGGEMIPQVAVLVKLQTSLRGRSNRGRVFLPMTAETAAGAGFVAGGEDVTITNAWTTFANALPADATTPADLVIASYDRRHAGAGAHATNVTAITCELALATQRRRQTRLR